MSNTMRFGHFSDLLYTLFYQKRRMPWRLVIGGMFSMCFVAIVINRIMVFHYYGSEINFSFDTFFWMWFIIVPDFLVLLILYTLLFYVERIYPQLSKCGIIIGLGFAVFILLVSTGNILMLKVTGQKVEWNIVFDVKVADTYSLYLSHAHTFLYLLTLYFLLGNILWFIVNYYIHTRNVAQFGHFKLAKILISGLILTYTVIVLFYHLPLPYQNLSSNMVLVYFSELFTYYWKTKQLMTSHIEKSVFDKIIPIIRAPAVDISRPLVTLKEPIKHVFIIVLESIRADVLPLNNNFAKTIQIDLVPNTTAENVTPFLNSLWMNSVRTVASVTSSYTLKSLLSTFCGIYPLNINFLAEVTGKNVFYEKCLPELLSENFPTTNNRSDFRSAFFTAARDDFDHQRDLFKNLKFDTVINGFDIYKQTGKLPDLGMFGPDDSYILPLMWKWLNNTLIKDPEKQLMMSLLVTGTHEPFPTPRNTGAHKTRHYTSKKNVNLYLNAMSRSDDFLKEIIDGFKLRNLYNETLFVIIGDHGYAFHDYGKRMVALMNNPLESAFSVPFILHNPFLEAKQIDGQFTNMDVLPTVMDILLSSRSDQQLTNQLLSIPKDQLEIILSQYEGTSILRMPVAQQSVRYTFHLSNPGNSYIIVRQYPKKLTYNIAKDTVELYHLTYDPSESTDLITLDHNPTASHPLWIETRPGKHSARTWKGRWINQNNSILHHSQILSQNKKFMLNSSLSTLNSSKIQLKDMLDWADQTLEIARLWAALIHGRYGYRRKI